MNLKPTSSPSRASNDIRDPRDSRSASEGLFKVGRRRDHGFWRDTPKDAWPALIMLAQPIVVLLSAWSWDRLGTPARLGLAFAVTALCYWNSLIVAHLLSHRTWFRNASLNRISEVVTSINALQSMEVYRIYHRNHHTFNNDQADAKGHTRDESSTFRFRKDGEHMHILLYGVLAPIGTALHHLYTLISIHRGLGVQPHEGIVTKAPPRQRRNVRVERIACALFLGVASFLSWRFVVMCLLPGWTLVLMCINISNYYGHYGAKWDDRLANAVSCYSPLFNLLTFNDGYHQEHHMAPGAHWTTMPDIRRRFPQLEQHRRVTSKWPAILGFFDRGRPMLHDRRPVERKAG